MLYRQEMILECANGIQSGRSHVHRARIMFWVDTQTVDFQQFTLGLEETTPGLGETTPGMGETTPGLGETTPKNFLVQKESGSSEHEQSMPDKLKPNQMGAARPRRGPAPATARPAQRHNGPRAAPPTGTTRHQQGDHQRPPTAHG
eukprot:gene10859-biopygen15368